MNMETDPPNNISPEPQLPSSRVPQKTNWLLFWIVLLAPVIASCIGGALDSRNGSVAPVVTLVGGGVAGIICGAMLGRRLGKTGGLRIVLGIVLALVMIVGCVGMSCFGCLAGGYQMRFN
jgi:hypothetical protein